MRNAIVVLALIAIVIAGAAFAEDKAAGKPQTECPIMGGKIDRSVYADHDGKRVYFCCDGCPADFKKDPAKYIKSMEDAGIVLEKPQTTCPVMKGGKIDKALFVEHEGQRVYFCCGGCPETFKKDPAKYMTALKEQGITLEKVQTTCPVNGDKIDKKVYADHEGQRIYFCCAGCVGKFKKDPATYVKKLIDAGVTPEPAPVAAKTGHGGATEKKDKGGHGGHMGH